MKPLYDDNVKPSLTAKIKSWLSLDYWAYRRLRRSARKAGLIYGVTALKPDTAETLIKSLSVPGACEPDKVFTSMVPPVFQLTPPDAHKAARKVIQERVLKREERADADVMRSAVQERMAARPESTEESARRVLARARGARR